MPESLTAIEESHTESTARSSQLSLHSVRFGLSDFALRHSFKTHWGQAFHVLITTGATVEEDSRGGRNTRAHGEGSGAARAADGIPLPLLPPLTVPLSSGVIAAFRAAIAAKAASRAGPDCMQGQRRKKGCLVRGSLPFPKAAAASSGFGPTPLTQAAASFRRSYSGEPGGAERATSRTDGRNVGVRGRASDAGASPHSTHPWQQ